jgi:GDP/UDP-N,N'-diacetylbacillosamine 2-epimerase (hydrolysing)
MKKIAVFTSTRADYGLLKQVIIKLNGYFDVDIIVSGGHFLESKGYSYNEIIEDNLVKEENIVRVEFFLNGCSSQALSKSIGVAQISFAQVLEKRKYKGIVILGDRYELFAISVPAMLYGIPLFHISGGEITEGVIDENIRHAHTKLSQVHLVANNIFANNVSSMGEKDWRICIVGECGLDDIYNFSEVSSIRIKNKFNIDLNKNIFLITFHPSTFEYKFSIEEQINSLLKALKEYKNYQKIFTAPGVEKDSAIITEKIKDFVAKNNNSIFLESLGRRNYLNVLKRSKIVIGNSSSGIVEAPSLGIPTINIGNRQKNRISTNSIINCSCYSREIKEAIKKSLSNTFQTFCRTVDNPYDPYKDGRNSERIVYAIKKALEIPKEKLMIKKFDTRTNKSKWNYLLGDFI